MPVSSPPQPPPPENQPDGAPGPKAFGRSAAWALTAADQVRLACWLALCWAATWAAWSLPQPKSPGWGQLPVGELFGPFDAGPEAAPSRSAPLPLDSPAKTPPVFQVELNRATWVELAQLPGLGRVLAQRIVEHRRRHGNFRSVEQLRQVRGIGPRRLQRLRPFVRVDSAD